MAIEPRKHAKPFGKKEKVLNYASNTYQLTRPNKVGEVDGLAISFPDVIFKESDPELDHAGDIDYIGKIGNKAFGIQIKPVTASTNFGNYNITERMSSSFQNFEEKFGGKVFVIFSTRTGNKKDIVNKDVIVEIQKEVDRLKNATIIRTSCGA